MGNTPNYDINYDDKRFTEVNDAKDAALSELESTYGGMISDADTYYQNQIAAANEWADTQKKNQQAQTDFAIEQINQQKQQAKEDYTKEQSGAYVDWQKQSNAYGANAEARAAQGMTNTGFSESSQVAMYNTYQQRVVAARESYTRAVLNYDNAIKEARLQNNSILAEIAYNALQTQLELSLQGFQYKNTLLLDKVSKKTDLEKMYHDRYQDVLRQINTENALAEDVRQYNETMAFNREKEKNDNAYRNQQLALQREQFDWQKEQANNSGGKIKDDDDKSSGNSVKDAFDEIVGNSSKSAGDLKVDTKSLNAAGFSGKSAAEIDKAVREGRLIEYEQGGILYYKLPAVNTSFQGMITNNMWAK